jgi:hypothetical protein
VSTDTETGPSTRISEIKGVSIAKVLAAAAREDDSILLIAAIFMNVYRSIYVSAN